MSDYGQNMNPQYNMGGGGSGRSSGPLIAGIIAIVLIAALSVVGYLFYKGMAEKKTENVSATKAPESSGVVSDYTSEAGEVIITDAGGSVIGKARKKDAEKYSVNVGGDWKIKIYEDRVKVKDSSGATLIKVKLKDYGFKVYAGDDDAATLFKGKYRGVGFKVKTDDAELGRVEPDGGGFVVTNDAGAVIGRVSSNGDTVKVVDGSGAVICTVKGASAKAAAFIPFMKDRLDAQLGVLVYFNEF